MNERILLIDDDPSVHEVARAYLEREGYIVYSATDGSFRHFSRVVRKQNGKCGKDPVRLQVLIGRT